MDDDGDDKDDTKRRTRNLSEKKRRDQFNLLVQELSTMVTTNSRKMDKSTVLKQTIIFLKNHKEITVRSRAHDVQEEWKPSYLSNEEFTYLILEAHEGFVMVFSSTGRICYVSESIASILGHSPSRFVNQSIFDFTCDEDKSILHNLLQTAEGIDHISNEIQNVTFELRMQRGALDFKDDTIYESVTFNGHFRTNSENVDVDHEGFHRDMDSRILFVGTGRLCMPQLIRDASLLDPNRGEFTSRHSLEWKFLFLDHRAPPIIGYLPFEVLGTSGYDYYHFDDLDKLVSCHEELMHKGELTSCYYRFLTKGQQWIWLQTRFFITYHQWHSKPEFVVCTHRVISYSDIAKATKPEGGDGDNASEAENSSAIKQPPSEETTLSHELTPSYTSEVSEPFASSYQTNSPAESVCRLSKAAPSENMTMAPVSPSYVSDVSEAYGSSYQAHSQGPTKRQRMNESGHPEVSIAPPSPSYVSEVSETFRTFQTHSQPASVRSASSAHGASWRCTRRYATVSDIGSVSGDSVASTLHSSRERTVVMLQQGSKVVPQHGIGAQYLEPMPYVTSVGVPAMLPLPLAMPLQPVIVAPPDHAQFQEQLERKHEELQQLIVRQQEELQHVKEQLLLARLGILQPVHVPYANQEQLQQQQQVSQPLQMNQPLPQISYPLQHPAHPQYQMHPPPQPPPGPQQHMPHQ